MLRTQMMFPCLHALSFPWWLMSIHLQDALNVAATTPLEDPIPEPLYASATMAETLEI